MPKCRMCNQRLSKLDKDVCPFCGARKPLLGVEDYTEDITKTLSAIKVEDITKTRNKNRLIFILLAAFFGVFGAHFYFYKRNKEASYILALSVCLIGLIGTLLTLYTTLYFYFAFLIPYVIIEIPLIISAFYFAFSKESFLEDRR